MMVSRFSRGLSLRLLQLAIGIGVIVFGLGLYSSQVAANSATANTLKLSPVRADIEVQPGESQIVQVTVTNLIDETVTVRPVMNDFISGDEQGTPALILDEDSYAPSRSLKRFMEPLDDITLPANESRSINVVINVPDGAKAGGYFGAVRFVPASPDDGGQVNLSPSVASLVLLRVPGEIDEKLTMTNFDVQQNGKSGKFFTSSENLNTLVRFTSDSGVQLDPIGKVSVQRGNRVVYEADFNNKSPRDMILPDSARRWEVPLNDISGFGKYTVSATFTYGQKNQTIDAEQTFWIIPVWMIIAAAVGLLVVIGLIIAIILLAKRRRHRLPRPSRSRGGLKL